MNSKTLHITNGDFTTNYLKNLQFKGDFITWREILCEGKTTSNVGSESFWKNRFHFFEKNYQISKKKFIAYTVKEYKTLCQKKEHNEIVLWFEYDLFCQINLIALLSWLKRHRKGHLISLVCSGKVNTSQKMHALTDLNEAQLKQHYKNRILLTQDDIAFADYIWQLYCSSSPLRLETISKIKHTTNLKYLIPALEAHLKRFPSFENGLNTIENTILETIAQNQPKTKQKLIKYLLKQENDYGFGDLQYQKSIVQLSDLFETKQSILLTKKGTKVLNNETNYYANLRDDFSYLGGAKKYNFLHYNQSNKLFQITS